MPVRFDEKSGMVSWLDQTRIPREEAWKQSTSTSVHVKALQSLEVRGAPTIGVFAAYCVAALPYNVPKGEANPFDYIRREAERVAAARPTAINLRWAVNQMLSTLIGTGSDVDLEHTRSVFVREARALEKNEYEAGKRIGEAGGQLIQDGDTIFTRCNAGPVACAGYGTAGGVIRRAWADGKDISVVVPHTAPLYQGARITMWELQRDGIPATLVADDMVGYAMANTPGRKVVVVGADRILMSGDVANKIGTMQDAILAKHFGIPFYVAAPLSTVDPLAKSIPIEMRNPEEVKTLLGRLPVTTTGARALSPAFDVTPHPLVTGIITEKGIARDPYPETLAALKGIRSKVKRTSLRNR